MLDPTLLTEVNRRIAQGERRAELQRMLIEHLRRRKKDTAAAKRMLKALVAAQKALLVRRDTLCRELEDQCFGGQR
jgi:hypothetical protein